MPAEMAFLSSLGANGGPSADHLMSCNLFQWRSPEPWPHSVLGEQHLTSSAVTSGAVLLDLVGRELPAWLAVDRGPVNAALAHDVRQKVESLARTAQIHARIGELKVLGAEEALPWSADSEDDFWFFISLFSNLRVPGIVLMDNGNLRAAWRNSAGEQVALEFRGYRQVYFVFFARRPDGTSIELSAGKDDVRLIVERITGKNLIGLLRGDG